MPLRITLTLWYGSALAAVLMSFALVVYAVMAKDLREQVDRQLENSAVVAIRSLQQKGFGPFIQFEDLSDQFPELAVVDKFFQIFSPTGRITIQSPNLRTRDIPLSRTSLESAFKGNTTLESAKFPGESPIRLISVPIVQDGTLVNIVQVGTSLQSVDEALHRLLVVLLLTGPVALGLSLIGGWFLAGRALRPVDQITSAAHRITASDLSQRLSVPTSSDEIGRLATTFNDMIARLEASFRQIRQFSADASHELRTPLTVMKGESELALRRSRSGDEYKAVLESNLEEIDRLSRIVDELLFLPRADLGQVKLERQVVKLDALVTDIQRQASVLGQDQQIHVALGPVDPVEVLGDEWRLRELLLNLVDNAIKYSWPGGTIELSLTRQAPMARLTVSDRGIGIPLDSQTRIFDRFFRADNARTHSKKGTGLGLALCKWIVEAHQGRIEVESIPGEYARFTIVLPLAPPAS
ncbi:MAG: heavy metal sensor histidine kinase [Nitrospirae bacterium]|nr:heavy metal sensor histidine kinase [Nitrospirota bacterium]